METVIREAFAIDKLREKEITRGGIIRSSICRPWHMLALLPYS